ALAAADGWSRLTAPLIRDHEYEPLAAGIDDIGAFLRTFSERLPDYPIHVQGHPPGPVVLAWVADRVGLGGAGWLAAVAIAGWAAAAVAALVAARALAGEGAARRAAPALAVLPAAVWAGTSLDGLFAGLGAVGLGLVAVALRRNRDGTGRRTPVPVALSGGAGVALGVALLCSYGAALLVVMAAAIVAVVAPEPARLLGPLAAGVLAPLALAAAAGFSWPDGLAATRDAYWAGVAGDRPAVYVTLAGNPGALGLAAGPAVAAGLAATLASPADRRARLLPAAALAAVVVANLSQMSRGEVERIWLPFVPWLALAAPGNRRGWLAAQAGLALGLQAALVASW
ncbi:MAG TPA: hypothetical protein VE575_15040, partial [Acidimicrobiales bacterium]|nr:hypothetical protein [Acidimicrobiales bacterium]